MNLNMLILVAAVIAVIVVILLCIYVKASPQIAFILSGMKKEPRILIGTGGFKIPFLERLDKLFLGQVTVDVKTSVPVPTHDFIDVMVDAVCKVRVNPNPTDVRLAAKNFLNMDAEEIAYEIQDSLEGNMREIVGSIDLQKLVTDRDSFSDEIQKKANTDMAKLGLEILSCNIQNITDQKGLIEGLGADNTEAIKKNAAITKANAKRDVDIAESKARKEANDVRVNNETEIAERNNELEIKKADLKKAADIKQAEADAAYKIQEQEQLKTINIQTVEADAARMIRTQERQKEINRLAVEAEVEKAKQEQLLKEQKIAIKQKELEAEINKQADADKYQIQIASEASKYEQVKKAEAILEQQKRAAEADTYKAIKEAEAIKAKAEAAKYEMEQKAAGIKAIGVAEAAKIEAIGKADAQAIRAKGIAEAEALDKKAEAMKKYGQAAIIDTIAPYLPEMAKAIAEPMKSIDSVNIYSGDGSSAVSKLASNVPTLLKQTLDTFKSVTGVDISTKVNDAEFEETK